MTEAHNPVLTFLSHLDDISVKVGQSQVDKLKPQSFEQSVDRSEQCAFGDDLDGGKFLRMSVHADLQVGV